MCHTTSPAKILRSVIRMTHFNRIKQSQNISPVSSKPLLTVEVLPKIDIPPTSKNLSSSIQSSVSINQNPKILSKCKLSTSEIVPGLLNEDEDTFSTYIDGYTLETTYICNFCYNDLLRSTQAIKKHLLEIHKMCTRPRANYHFEPRFQCLS